MSRSALYRSDGAMDRTTTAGLCGKRVSATLSCYAFALAVLLTLGSVPIADAVSPLELTDATFTDDVVNREPNQRLSSFSLRDRGDDARLWFWFRVHCGNACHDTVVRNPQIPIYVKWAYHQDGKYIVKRTVPLKVQGSNWRTWAYKQNLSPGTWLVAVFGEEGVVCLGSQCEFTVQVTP